MSFIQLGIVEDDATIRDTLAEYLSRQPEFDIVKIAGSVEEFLYALPQLKALNTLVLDIGLPGMSGLDGMSKILHEKPKLDIVILSAFEDHDRIYRALCGGAVSYLSKRTPLPQIKDALLTVHRGGSYMSPEIARKVIEHMPQRPRARSTSVDLEILTPRQKEIVQGLVEGLSYKLIADKLDISVETVRDHIKKIYKKLQVNSKAEVIRKAMRGD